MLIKKYIAMILQMFIWSGFTLVDWLSRKDHSISKVILFIVFFYLAFLLAKALLKTRKRTIWITILSLTVYQMMNMILHIIFIGKITL
ncbi:hypothetical protein [Bacillus sp. FSL K6-3431]|uniref:hypothetical protein n=1 Tax=Bacillus sp. FSL K6-3431 TaxID=2921500 RepID=UPI0030F75D75